jgi:hypothetical protein
MNFSSGMGFFLVLDGMCFFVCLHFVNKQNTLYGSFGCLKDKCFETWWMTSPNPKLPLCDALLASRNGNRLLLLLMSRKRLQIAFSSITG